MSEPVMIRLKMLKEAAEQALPGTPWRSETNLHGVGVIYDGRLEGFVAKTWKRHPRKAENAQYVALADPPTVLAMVDVIEAADGLARTYPGRFGLIEEALAHLVDVLP